MTQFDIDYEWGKESEISTKPFLEKLFKKRLTQCENVFSNFDYYGDNIYVELKTRNIEHRDGKFYYTNRKGYESIIDTLYFDEPKLNFAKKNKTKDNEFYIVWKCVNCLAIYKINLEDPDEVEYYIKPDFNDYGHGYRQHRNIVNVFTDKVTIINKC